MRVVLRLALAGWLGLAAWSLLAAQGRAATPPEKIVPDSTVLFLKINNTAAFRESFRQTELGQLWADPALKGLKDDLADRIDEATKSLKDKLGVSIRDLLELPQGTAAIAVVKRDHPKLPIAVLLMADAGKNTSAMTDVLTRATKQGEESGFTVTTESFRGADLHVLQPPKEKEKDKANDQDKDQPKENPPVVWTHLQSLFFVGSDVDALKDLLAHAQGRDDALAANESFTKIQGKLGSEVQVVWFIDVAKLVKQVVAVAGATAKEGAGAQAQQAEAMLQVMGFNGLKALGGGLTFNTGGYDSVNKTIVLAPAPVQGVLKVFDWPKAKLRPESWVPAAVATYQSLSWDLDKAFTALNDLVNTFQPGMLNVVEQSLVGPNGGDPISFQKDIFGPLGNRITLISDFKKPITENSQRMLVAFELQDARAFQNTLNRLMVLTGAAPKKREFQGTTIYDFELPNLPAPNNAGGASLKGPVSVAIAKDTLFASTDPTFLEQVLRGGPGLADSAAFQSVAKELPDRVSSMSYSRSDEQARLSYDMIKSGKFEKAIQNAAAAGNGGEAFAKLGKVFDKQKLPEFSVFAKYISPGGGYSVMEDDGLTLTGFTLRKTNP
jgi:hypothetical protein